MKTILLTRDARSYGLLSLRPERILRSEGIDRVFGNPGTTELPLMDALSSASDIEYVLGAHEGAVVSMADGYARASGHLPS